MRGILCNESKQQPIIVALMEFCHSKTHTWQTIETMSVQVLNEHGTEINGGISSCDEMG